MKKLIAMVGTAALTTTAAHAGGIDRSGQSVGLLFEKGNYAEVSFGSASPEVSGVGAGTAVSAVTPTPGQKSGDMAADFKQVSGGVKYQFNDRAAAALIIDQPYGANVDYPAGTTYFARGSTAEIKTLAVTGLAKYSVIDNLSVYGGLRYQTLSAEASIPFVRGYTGEAERDSGIGYVAGVAYEKPEIALRVALTHNSKIKHDLKTHESSSVTPARTTTTTVETPQSVNLEFQSGVAKNTLAFGSARWVDWSSFKMAPATYSAMTGNPLVSYRNDTTNYSLGVGHRLDENWSASASVGYEKAGGGFSSNLGPTDGKKSLTLAAVYTRDKMKITTGVSYTKVGNTTTTLGGGATAANFSDNKALGVGIKLGYSF